MESQRAATGQATGDPGQHSLEGHAGVPPVEQRRTERRKIVEPDLAVHRNGRRGRVSGQTASSSRRPPACSRPDHDEGRPTAPTPDAVRRSGQRRLEEHVRLEGTRHKIRPGRAMRRRQLHARGPRPEAGNPGSAQTAAPCRAGQPPRRRTGRPTAIRSAPNAAKAEVQNGDSDIGSPARQEAPAAVCFRHGNADRMGAARLHSRSGPSARAALRKPS